MNLLSTRLCEAPSKVLHEAHNKGPLQSPLGQHEAPTSQETNMLSEASTLVWLLYATVSSFPRIIKRLF